MTKRPLCRAAVALLFAVGLAGCASQTQTATSDSRQPSQRRPGPNLDRTYDWGSMPPPGPAQTHSED